MVPFKKLRVPFIVALLSGKAFAAGAFDQSGQEPLQLAANQDLSQTLRHVFYHSVDGDEQALFLPVIYNTTDLATIQGSPLELKIKVRNAVPRSSSVDSSGKTPVSAPPPTLVVPDVTDKQSIINLASMTSDVYLLNSSNSGWINLTQGFYDGSPFGYHRDGLQGHIFANADNSTVVVAFKGTTISFFGNTTTKDKLNDNLLFSCCCGAQRPDPYWYAEVCSCATDTYKCNSSCLTTELARSDRYYAAASSIMRNVTRDLFAHSSLWTTGHSLGGALASLIGLEFELPVVTFETPPQRLPAERLGLVPRDHNRTASRFPAYHFGNTGDPIFSGACSGFLSLCSAAGFDFESRCFTGNKCIYDTVTDLGWSTSVLNHRISTVIEEVLKKYDKVPECVAEASNCIECSQWEFY